MSYATVVCPVYRCLHSPLGTKSFIRLYLTHVTFCSTQKRGNRFRFSLLLSPSLLFLVLTVLFVYSIVPRVWVLQWVCDFVHFRCSISTWRREPRKKGRRRRTSWCRPRTNSGGWWRKQSSLQGKGSEPAGVSLVFRVFILVVVKRSFHKFSWRCFFCACVLFSPPQNHI